MDFTTINEELFFIQKRNEVIRNIEELLFQKDYIKVETDYFEEYDKYVELNQRQDRQKMVKVQDNSGRVLVLRPDITSNIIKQVIPRYLDNSILKLYYLDSIFSVDVNGIIEQKKQCGVEIIGDKKTETDTDLIQMVITLFENFQIEPIIEIGNQQFINILIEQSTTTEEQRKTLMKIIQRKSKNELLRFIALYNVPNKYQELLSNIFQYQNDFEQIKDLIIENKLDQRLLKVMDKMITIKNLLQQDAIRYDLSLVTDFDYYSGIIFKGYIKGMKTDIFRGGRYDLLTKEYGKEVPALGFSIDIQSLIEVVIGNG